MRLRFVGVLFGALFGFVLGWARLTDYDTIRNMLLLREPDVFLLMGSAIGTAAAGVRLLRAIGARSVLDGSPVAWTTARPTGDHVVGSALFGLGWSIACTCPGPIAAQLGRGQVVGIFTGLGLFAGIALHDALLLGTESRQPAVPSPEPAASSVGL